MVNIRLVLVISAVFLMGCGFRPAPVSPPSTVLAVTIPGSAVVEFHRSLSKFAQSEGYDLGVTPPMGTPPTVLYELARDDLVIVGANEHRGDAERYRFRFYRTTSPATASDQDIAEQAGRFRKAVAAITGVSVTQVSVSEDRLS